MNYKHNPDLTNTAKALRKNMTEQERKLWYCFLRDYPVRFLRQKVIDDYIVDFYCAKASLVIELDGSQHFEEAAQEYDRKRSEALEKRGLRIVRIPNNEVNENFSGVCEYIEKLIEKYDRH